MALFPNGNYIGVGIGQVEIKMKCAKKTLLSGRESKVCVCGHLDAIFPTIVLQSLAM